MNKPAITFYGYYRSSTSFRVRLALMMKGLAYDYKSVNLLDKEHHGAAYKAVNPQGLVPAIVHEGQTLTQSLAILEYLDEIAPEPPLIWGDAAQRAKIRAMAQIIACDIHPMNNLSVWKGYVGGVLGADDAQMGEWYAHWITQGLAAYDGMMTETARFSCGDDISMADICLLPQLYNARRFHVDLGAFKNILRVEQNMLDLVEVQASLPERQSDAPKDLEPVYKL